MTPSEIEVRIWGFVVIVVMMVFAGITAAMLYSVIFVSQPIKSMAPIDQAFTKMLNDIVLLIVGGIGAIMGKRAVGAVANAMGTPTPPPLPPQQYMQVPVPQGYQPSYAPPPPPAPSGMPNFNWMGYQNPELDETWTPPPPPTTPPEHLESDEEREHMALARKEAQ